MAFDECVAFCVFMLFFTAFVFGVGLGKYTILGVMFLIGIIVLGIFLRCRMFEASTTSSKSECPLCKSRMRVTQLSQHRILCANTYSAFLNSLPSFPGVNCDMCGYPLRLWPKSREPRLFICSSRTCPIRANSDIENNGSNCYHCFVCNLSRCGMCAQSRVTGHNNQTTSNSISTAINPSSLVVELPVDRTQRNSCNSQGPNNQPDQHNHNSDRHPNQSSSVEDQPPPEYEEAIRMPALKISD